jgi:hypothetical protein
MAQRLKLTVPDPQDIIDTYGAAPLMRIERSSDYTVADPGSANWSEIGTKVVVAGTVEYEYIDSTGVAGTHWGRTRFSIASPDSADDYSGFSIPFLYGALPGGPLSLETAKLWGSYDGTADDSWLALAVDAVNRAGISLIGVDLGPSPDTTRDTYLASDVKQDGKRLYIPGGIRSFLTVSTGDGTTWTAITSYVRVGPVSHSRPPGEPGSYIEVRPEASVRLDASYYIKVTATAFEGFGWDAWPMDLVQDALAAVQRMSLDRARGGNYPSEIAALRYLHAPLWRGYGARYFPMVR